MTFKSFPLGFEILLDMIDTIKWINMVKFGYFNNVVFAIYGFRSEVLTETSLGLI